MRKKTLKTINRKKKRIIKTQSGFTSIQTRNMWIFLMKKKKWMWKQMMINGEPDDGFENKCLSVSVCDVPNIFVHHALFLLGWCCFELLIENKISFAVQNAFFHNLACSSLSPSLSLSISFWITFCGFNGDAFVHNHPK